jgi:hypothetical protein
MKPRVNMSIPADLGETRQHNGLDVQCESSIGCLVSGEAAAEFMPRLWRDEMDVEFRMVLQWTVSHTPLLPRYRGVSDGKNPYRLIALRHGP